ncbi:WXG100 family type VII secretion target [Streptomyces sp. NPDC127110]|uniref:WXG100 family type VII secretion target n=1 Tax=Streptomyces sp. NPDC127110 TaxID=3345362 RepID=UPI00362A4E4C
MATTNFEGHSHEQLLAMIASVNPETVKARATQLADAAKALNEIGDSLKRHRVKGWEGEAAHAFQDWVSRTGSATLALGKFSEVAGTWMESAAQTMVEVKANTPKYDTSAAGNLEAARKFHNDPDAQKLGQTAHSKLTSDHQQAVQQLTKLAQSYEASATQMNWAEPPTFPPPPGSIAPGERHGDSDTARPLGGASSGGYSASSPYGVSGSPAGVLPQQHGANGGLPQSDHLPSSTPGLAAVQPPVPPDRGVDVDLDHVVMLPDRTLPPTPGLPVVPGPGGNPPSGPVPPLMLPPISVQPGLGGGPLPLTRLPAGNGGKVGGTPVPPPRDTGIVGGRPISTGGPNAGIPRGTVIGADGPHSGGRAMPGMMGGGFGGPHGSPGGSATGRRLAMEPGGVVGGRPATTGSQAFTQGGSGLVRGSSVGAVGHGGAASPAPSRRRGGQGGDRPDYLAEDEETWQGNRRVVPPVID